MEKYKKPQDYSNHARYVMGYHRVLFTLLMLSFIGSFVNLNNSFHTPNLYSASLIVAIHVVLVLLFWYARAFPLRAQDRAIRAEENLRHYVLTGNLLDARLRMGQIVALRFASDDELVTLAKKAVDEKMRPDDIKKAVKSWRADYYRA
ncbi:MAG: DUF6526 family protein [Bacteroidota bacterium]